MNYRRKRTNNIKRIAAGIGASLTVAAGLGMIESGHAKVIGDNVPALINAVLVIGGLIGTIWHPKH